MTLDALLPWQSVNLWASFGLFACFVFSGFVRSGLGFGGAALSLPFMLLVVDRPVELLPVISIHLIIFGLITTGANLQSVDWTFLKRSLKVMIIPKILGVLGLIFVAPEIMILVIYAILFAYSIVYMFGRSQRPLVNSKLSIAWDRFLLILGAYMSGVSLVGAPLIIPVYTRHIAKALLRNTLFVLWIILVTIKLAAFVVSGTDLQLIHQLWLLPAAGLGHVLGMRFHHYLQQQDDVQFKRVIGLGLMLVILIGLSKYL